MILPAQLTNRDFAKSSQRNKLMRILTCPLPISFSFLPLGQRPTAHLTGSYPILTKPCFANCSPNFLGAVVSIPHLAAASTTRCENLKRERVRLSNIIGVFDGKFDLLHLNPAAGLQIVSGLLKVSCPVVNAQ